MVRNEPKIDPDFLDTFPLGFCRRHGIALLAGDGSGPATLLRTERTDERQIELVSRRLKRPVRPELSPPDVVERLLEAAHAAGGSRTASVLRSIAPEDDAEGLLRDVDALSRREDLLDTEGRAPIIRLVNHILLDAVRAGASDVHVQPREDRLVVRQRIDGVLFDTLNIPKHVQEEVLTRIKVLGRMNIAEKRLPQDGRASVTLGDREVDLRIASLPTSHNERIVIRLLDKSARLYSLDELGMPRDQLAVFERLIRRDHGMILVTGPTGSGKSTTLYGALQRIDAAELNVLTLEDPIEYRLDGISQTQINEKKGLTFGSGLRSVLRQDPDIIMVGEIRDADTASMAIQASLTGHLVFSTLHTNDASGAITRLTDLGVEPYLVSSSLIAVLAQRLVRRLCDRCKQPAPDNEAVDGLGGVGGARPAGCEHCRGTGYRGRIGLFELLVVDETIRSLATRRAPAAEIRSAAVAAGLKLLANDGRDKVAGGLTTPEEVARVTSGY